MIKSVLVKVFRLALQPMDATVASVAVDVRLVLHPLHLDATVLSAHVALCSGDDLESVKELVLRHDGCY